MNSFKQHILDILEKELKKKDLSLEIPPDSKMGEFAFPCFSLSKELKKSPNQIAQELKEKIKPDNVIVETVVQGPYLNFFVNNEAIATETIAKVFKEKDNYGSTNVGKNKKLILEHTSINPNASPHVGRARNAMIGDSLGRILRFLKYKVEVHYLVNDIGKQIGMLVLGAREAKKLDFEVSSKFT